MKKIILNYILILLAGLLMFSCEDFDPEIHYYDSVKIKLKSNEISVLDSKVKLEIDFVSTSKHVSKVIISVGDKEISTGTAKDNKYSFDFARLDFPDTAKVDYKQKISINASVDGVVKQMYTNITLVSATKLEAPTEVFELSDLDKMFVYSVDTKMDQDIDLKTESKIGSQGTYTLLWTKKYDKTNLSFPVQGNDYNLGDTVYVRLTSIVSSYSESVEEYFVVKPYLLNKTSSASVSFNSKYYDLIGNKETDESGSHSLSFIYDMDASTIGILCENGLEMLPVEDLETNVSLINTAFDASSSILKLNQATIGDKFLLKQSIGGDIYYGNLTITNLNRTNIKEDGLINFNFVLEKFSLKN